VQGDRDRLLRIFHLALAARGFQFAMLELVHHPLDRLLLRWALVFRHRLAPEPLSQDSSGETAGAVIVRDAAESDLVP
jgi:hypothetical protein